MAIYNIFDYYEKEVYEKVGNEGSSSFYLHSQEETGSGNYVHAPKSPDSKGQIFSAICARFFFFLLLLVDLAWGSYHVLLFTIKAPLYLLTLCQFAKLKKSTAKSLLNIRRALVCGVSLFVAIFSPALGIMFSCMYFLMYDKSGVEEVVPSSLREQFESMFPGGTL